MAKGKDPIDSSKKHVRPGLPGNPHAGRILELFNDAVEDMPGINKDSCDSSSEVESGD